MILSGKKLPLAHANPLASVAIWPFVVLTCTLGIILLTQKQLAIFATVFLASIFAISYLTICQWAKTRNMLRFGLYSATVPIDKQTPRAEVPLLLDQYGIGCALCAREMSSRHSCESFTSDAFRIFSN